ncbi:CxC2 domain-containing protein [Mycena indigotica]|uniref:CxC2 domain-containing protein n=1 Tax=Mycena indigotica TaxID=2126181 RepID=A0A8H6S3B1_9AGAR|nr:CxC2 domain-containing protein [Mycena indigotica]KAF7292129.1 CxC2 domain-containing protein [Mycena indigotica]
MATSSSRKRRAAIPPTFVHHHMTPIADLVGAPVDAPLATTIHRVTSDNRRVRTETVLVSPSSPVKRARLSHLARQEPLLPLPGDEPERYEIGSESDDAGPSSNPAGARQSQPALNLLQDKAMQDWAEKFRDKYLQAMLWRNGRGKQSELCASCGSGSQKAIYRCESCHGDRMVCAECCVQEHETNPTHFIEKWTGVYFMRISSRELGLRIQFGHLLGQTCPLPRTGRPDFVIIADNGIHEVGVDFCGCQNSDPNYIQLLKAGYYPATTSSPRTCATFSCLDRFHYLSLRAKTTAYDYYSTLESLTDGLGIKPPDRYSIFLRISRQYRHLKLLKRMGRGHDAYGVMGTGPGELALKCPACPRPGVNLPEGWEDARPEDQCLYIMFIAMDACFRLKRAGYFKRASRPWSWNGLGVHARMAPLSRISVDGDGPAGDEHLQRSGGSRPCKFQVLPRL